jgi:hypothetical protein
MNLGPCRVVAAASLTLVLSVAARGALIVNSPMPITHLLRVNPIIVSNDMGGDTATFMGAAEAAIKGMVDTIWAQAGIDVQWLTPQTFNNTETLNGGVTTTGVTRPSTDLNNDPMGNDHETLGQNAGKRVAGAINMFFVNVAAGFQLLTEGHVAGLAEVPGDDVSMYVGDNLVTVSFTGGHEAVAGVISHEIGHNLGLPHPVSVLLENLMNANSSASPGQRLTSSQVMTARGSGLLVAIPEVNAFVLVASVGALACIAAWKGARGRAAA